MALLYPYCRISHGCGRSPYNALGRQRSLTSGERDVFLRTAMEYDRPIHILCSLLYDPGCRITAALHLTPRRVDVAAPVIIVESLTKRRRGVYRAVPVSPALLDTLVSGVPEPCG
jgi:integrase/recombinase XerD